MAQKTLTTDDIDGSAGAETVSFTIDGAAYEIDLNRKNRAAFLKAVQPFVDAARTATTAAPAKRTRRVTPKAPGRRQDLSDIRLWANAHGYQVSSRGRISTGLVEQYDREH